jgi:hypothetical protein
MFCLLSKTRLVLGPVVLRTRIEPVREKIFQNAFLELLEYDFAENDLFGLPGRILEWLFQNFMES